MLARLATILVILVGLSLPARAAETSITTQFLSQTTAVHLPEGNVDITQTLASARIDARRIYRNLDLRAYIPVAWTRENPSGDRLEGLGDVQLRLSRRPAGSRWSAMIGCDLPTGKTHLTEEEYRVASRFLASRVLDFRLKRPGEGFDLLASVSTSRSIARNTVLGLALAGYLKSSHVVQETSAGGELSVSPGNRLHGSLTLLAREHDQDPIWDLQTVLTLQTASAARLETGGRDTEVREGTQVTVEAAYNRTLREESRLVLSAFMLLRDRNRIDGSAPAAEEILGISTRWITELAAVYSQPFAGRVDLALGLSHAVFRIDPTRGVNSRLTSLDLRARGRISAGLALEGLIRMGYGRTPWSVGDNPHVWQKRDLSSLNLGVRAEIQL